MQQARNVAVWAWGGQIVWFLRGRMASPCLAARGMEETLAAHAAALKQAEAQREEETGALQEQLRAAEARPGPAWGCEVAASVGRTGVGWGLTVACGLPWLWRAVVGPFFWQTCFFVGGNCWGPRRCCAS